MFLHFSCLNSQNCFVASSHTQWGLCQLSPRHPASLSAPTPQLHILGTACLALTMQWWLFMFSWAPGILLFVPFKWNLHSKSFSQHPIYYLPISWSVLCLTSFIHIFPLIIFNILPHMYVRCRWVSILILLVAYLASRQRSLSHNWYQMAFHEIMERSMGILWMCACPLWKFKTGNSSVLLICISVAFSKWIPCEEHRTLNKKEKQRPQSRRRLGWLHSTSGCLSLNFVCPIPACAHTGRKEVLTWIPEPMPLTLEFQTELKPQLWQAFVD